MKFIIFIVGSLLFMECNQKLSLSNDWVKDKYGCFNLRTKELADSLINKNNLYSKGEKEFIKVFGNADYTVNNGYYKDMCYYYDSNCNNCEIIKSSDKCVFIFEFKKDSLFRFYQQCE